MNDLEVQVNVRRLHEKIAAVAPILGVSIGVYDDKTTWKVAFDQSALPEQKSAAQAILDSFDIAAMENQPGPKMDLEAELNALKDALLRKGTLLQSEIEFEKSKR